MPPRKIEKYLKKIKITVDSSYHQVNTNDKDQNLFSQQIMNYINSKKELYNSIISFLENFDYTDNDFQDLIKIIQQLEKDDEEFKHFLYLISQISDNHHRDETFLKNIFQIIQFYKLKIKQTFSNFEIYEIFKNNKIVLLFLLENEIIKMDENIYYSIINKIDSNGNRYSHFFYPEIKEFIGEEKIKELETELLSQDDKIFDNFNEKRHKGENDSYICTLIRQDSVKDFIIYINQTNLSLRSVIMPSIFETNSLLNEKNPTLIEYAAFFGSIQIFRFLMMNDVILTPSLWLYAIHSKNAELIHLLESNDVHPPIYNENDNYIKCLSESIKCHHNDIAEYIKTNLFDFDKMNSHDYEIYISCILQYHNYANFPTDFDNDDEFFYLCRFNYDKLISFFVKKKEKFLEDLIKKKEYQIILSIDIEYKVLIFYYLLLRNKNINTGLFKLNKVFKKIAIPPSIALIGDSFFYKYKSLVQIAIPSSVASIGDSAFCGCSRLTQITIPSSVTSIGKNAFRECSSLTKITIPSFVSLIEDSAFDKCSSLTQITISSSVTSIGKNAFRECKSLTEITIPSSVTSIGESAFRECLSLTQITIPSSVTSIGNSAFNGCSSLTQITIPSSVTSIGESAFRGCLSLTQITIPSSVTSIGESAFRECSSLTQITIPSSVTSIGESAFRGCSRLTQITIPSSVTSIGDSAFWGCSRLTQITIPSSVTSIGKNAFRECSSLTEITIPSFVSLIEDSAFDKCSSLTQITIPSSVASIGKYAFFGCSSLTQITIPSSVTSIGNYAFFRCSSLTQITIPSSVTSIGSKAFAGCSLLAQNCIFFSNQ